VFLGPWKIEFRALFDSTNNLTPTFVGSIKGWEPNGVGNFKFYKRRKKIYVQASGLRQGLGGQAVRFLALGKKTSNFPNQFMIADESQNPIPLEVKTVITRVGHDTKIILTSDLYQIDNPYVDSLSNGLSAVVEKFRNASLVAHMLMAEGVRSDLAEKAANLL